MKLSNLPRLPTIGFVLGGGGGRPHFQDAETGCHLTLPGCCHFLRQWSLERKLDKALLRGLITFGGDHVLLVKEGLINHS